MNDSTLRAVEAAATAAARGEPEPRQELERRAARPVLPIREARPEAAPAPAITPEKRLEEALGALPQRFLRAARAAARLTDTVEEWRAVETAFDALVSGA